MKTEHPYMPLVRIDAPEIYADPAFQQWLNDPEKNQATWHTKGQAPGEYSDIFFTVDPPEGSDSDMPEHCWDKILAAVEEAIGANQEALVWLANLPTGDADDPSD